MTTLLKVVLTSADFSSVDLTSGNFCDFVARITKERIRRGKEAKEIRDIID